MSIIHLFKTPSAHQIALRELENAQRELITAHASAEYAAKMVEYYQGMVARLNKTVSTNNKETCCEPH